LARRFRGFINPQPLAQNVFEALRKPHIVADNLEPPATAAADPPAAPAPEEPVKPAVLASAAATPVPAAPQAVVSETPLPPAAPLAPSRFPIHSLVLALCG